MKLSRHFPRDTPPANCHTARSGATVASPYCRMPNEESSTDRTRTCDPGLMNPLLYQLSYGAETGVLLYMHSGQIQLRDRRRELTSAIAGKITVMLGSGTGAAEVAVRAAGSDSPKLLARIVKSLSETTPS